MTKSIKAIRIFTLTASLFIIAYSIFISRKDNIRLYNSSNFPFGLLGFFILSVLLAALIDLLITKKFKKMDACLLPSAVRQYTQSVLLLCPVYLFFVGITFMNTISFQNGIELKMGYGPLVLTIVFINLAVALILLPVNVIAIIIHKAKRTNRPTFFYYVNILLSIINFLLAVPFFIFSFIENFQFK